MKACESSDPFGSTNAQKGNRKESDINTVHH